MQASRNLYAGMLYICLSILYVYMDNAWVYLQKKKKQLEEKSAKDPAFWQ